MARRLRPERVGETLRHEVSNIVQFELKDPRLGFITITKVTVTPDLRFARIAFSVLEDDKRQLALKCLTNAKGFIRKLIGERVKLQFVPEIAFEIDRSYEHTKHIHDVLDKLNKEKEESRDVDKEGD
jgi:ribosome-binding factor A